jgi:ribosomal protein S18 acetylase RimI-like enzyme
MQLTMRRELPALHLLVPASLPGLLVLPPLPSLTDALAGLIFAGYGEGFAHPDLTSARADVVAALAGDYGPLDGAASGVAVEADGAEPVAAVLAVQAAVWEDVAGIPFVIDLVTAPRWRRQGVGRWLLTRCLAELSASGAREVGLRVESANLPAVALYASLGFARTSR